MKLYIAGEAHHTGPRARFPIDWMVHPCTKGRADSLARAPVLSLWLGFGVYTARSRSYAGDTDRD